MTAKFAHLLLLGLILLPLSHAFDITDNDNYRLNTAGERSENVTGNTSSTVYYPSLSNDCAGNPCHYTFAEMDYKIPIDHVTSYNPKWYVKHGSLTAYNISVPATYNATHYRVRSIGVYHSSAGYDIGSGVQYHNGTAWVWFGQNDSDTPAAMTLVATTEGTIYDGNYLTGAWCTTNCTLFYYDNEATPETEATLWDNNLYWVTGIPVQAYFTIRNEYGKPVEGALVTATRQADNITQDSDTTDLSGKVRLDLGDDLYYTINVTHPGYNNFSGTVHLIDTSYIITVTQTGYTGTVYESIFQNLTFITTPSENPPAAVTNFTMQLNDTASRLVKYGIYTTFNGTYYDINGTNPNGSLLNITMNLTGFGGSSINIYYWFHVNGSPTYELWAPFYIGGVNATNSTLGGVATEFLAGMSELGRAALGTAMIIALMIVAILAGIPPPFAAALAVPAFIVGGVLGFFDPVIAVIVAVIMAGVVVLSNRGGLA